MIFFLIIIIILALSIAIYFYYTLFIIQKRLQNICSDSQNKFSIPNLLDTLEKQKYVLNLNFASNNINSPSSLAESLREIVNITYQIFNPKYIELILKDSETEVYHSSISLGTPVSFDTESKKYYEVEKPILFSANQLGEIKLIFGGDRQLTASDHKLLDILCLQSGISILNDEYSKELLRLKSASEESVKAKTGFLANLSHELRGPLGVILNAVEIVSGGMCGEVSELQKKTLDMVQKNGNHLLDLINDVLDYAKIEAGKVTPKIETLSSIDLINDISKLLATQIVAKKHKLIKNLPENDLYFLCDRRHSRQILINLMTNAIKYTSDGGQIKISSERLKGGKIKIVVEDSGVGIPEDQKEKVFSAFERVEHSYSIKQVGTGLGMPLTKKLIEVNGGSINFDSKEGEGSVFWVIFEEVNENQFVRKKDQAEIEDAKGAGENILIIEPDNNLLNVYETYLKKIGFNVLALNEFRLIDNFQPKIVIIENKVLDHNSENIINKIRTNYSQSHISFILLSSKAFEFDVEHYLKLGIDVCLSKPVSLKELGHKIKNLSR